MTSIMLRHTLVFSLLGLCLTGSAAAQATVNSAEKPAAKPAEKLCRIAGFAQELRCGVVQRPLNPEQPDGTRIEVHYAVLPSQDKNKLHDAVFLLAGGPGQSAINVAGFGQAVLGRLNKRRDLVFVDQRGTGRSASLDCPELNLAGAPQTDDQQFKHSEACRERLQKLPYGDLRYFTTSIAVQDLEAVRQQQGYDKINLVGASYGTRVGLEYLRQFPGSVRRVVLDGVVPPQMRIPDQDAGLALQGVFDQCSKNKVCNTAYPDLQKQWQELLKSTPKQIRVVHPRLGTALDFTLSRATLIGMVHRSLYSPVAAAALPFSLHQAAHGNFQALVALSGMTNLPGPEGINYGMHFSVWCSEIFARPLDPANDDFDQVQQALYQRTCKNWPRGKIPDGFFSIPAARSPVLLLSGGIDPVTPVRHGDMVAAALGKNALHVSLQNAGHGLLAQGCMPDVVFRFLNAIDDAAALKTDHACVRQIPRPTVWLPWQTMPGEQQ